jgi:hypothetical protein
MRFPGARRSLRTVLYVLSCAGISIVHADTAIETETAQIGKKGESNFSQAFEFEKAIDGSGQGTLTQYEYGLSDRAEILIEPFFYVRSAPDDGPAVSGVGDLEITPSYMAVREDGAIPAVLFAFKVKVPTGTKRVEGTGKVDFYPYLIFGKHYGGWTLNANLGVNFAQPVDENRYQKDVVWDLEAEREIAPRLTMFFEAFSAEDGVKTLSTSAEYQFTPRFNAFAVISRTEEHSNIVRIGFNYAVTGARN